MIDFHSHVLPSIDDGARDAEEAKKMLETAKEQGVKTVLLTPHYYGQRRSPKQFLELRQQAYEEIKAVAPDGVSLVQAAEVHFAEDGVVSFADICSLAIENTKAVLIEFPFLAAWTKSPLEKIHDFVVETGYTPIIAHVERYQAFQKNPSLMTDFVEAGCLLQVNTETFLNKETKNFAFAMLKKGLVHCLGTDMHGAEDRKCDYALAKAAIEAEDAFAFECVQDIMQGVLNGETVRPEVGIMRRFMGKYY